MIWFGLVWIEAYDTDSSTSSSVIKYEMNEWRELLKKQEMLIRITTKNSIRYNPQLLFLSTPLPRVYRADCRSRPARETTSKLAQMDSKATEPRKAGGD